MMSRSNSANTPNTWKTSFTGDPLSSARRRAVALLETAKADTTLLKVADGPFT
jgi:hypothetical protein